MWLLDFFRNSADSLIIIAIVVVLIILFAKDFDLNSKRSWGILLGLTALGGIFAIRAIKKHNLLKELAQREKALKELEKKYKDLKDQGKITEDKYVRAKVELDVSKANAAKAVLSAETTYREELDNIEKEHENISPEDLIKQSFDLLGRN
ncbi:MAG: hypothetical protein AAGA66_11020 [Bacteroidota bacterium]